MQKTFMYFSAGKKPVVPFEYFIARKVLKNEVQGKKVSRPIVRISVTSIALAVVVNLITIAVVTGFQREVRNKVSGFGSHIFIMNSSGGSIYECEPILKNQTFLKTLSTDKRLTSVHPVAYKPVIFQSDKFERSFRKNGRDTSYLRQEIHGAILKGVEADHDWTFFREHLKKGRLPKFEQDEVSNEILLSDKIAGDLHLKVGDEVKAYFVKSQPVRRNYKLVGIYKTGLEEFDKRIAIGDLRAVQELNDWGIKASITVDDTLYNGQFIIRGDITGGNGNYRYDWGTGYENASGFVLCPVKDTTIRLIASDYWSNIRGTDEQTSIPDTAYLEIRVSGTGLSYCDVRLNQDGTIKKTFLKDDGSEFKVHASQKSIAFRFKNGKGSSRNYVGGYEVTVSVWNELPETYEDIRKQISFIPSKEGETFAVRSIMENENDIFVWLGFLDLNVVIILTLMILIGIINMGSALLVLILVRSNFIGLMKAMGATDWMVRKIFLYQAAFLIIRGIVIGNVIGLGLCGLQYFFGILKLNPEVYYLDSVPIDLDLWAWAALNAGTLLVCVLALIIPSYAITRISPAKTIRFN